MVSKMNEHVFHYVFDCINHLTKHIRSQDMLISSIEEPHSIDNFPTEFVT